MKRIIFTLALMGLVSGSNLQADAISKVPGVGMISDKVNFDGVTLKDFKFVDDNRDSHDLVSDKYIITKKKRECLVEVSYELDADVLANLKLHHLLYGLHKEGPQGCFLHSLGLSNRKGKTNFVLTAPKEKGVYQVRFCTAEGYGSFEAIKEAWWNENSANADTIMGIVIVR